MANKERVIQDKFSLWPKKAVQLPLSSMLEGNLVDNHDHGSAIYWTKPQLVAQARMEGLLEQLSPRQQEILEARFPDEKTVALPQRSLGAANCVARREKNALTTIQDSLERIYKLPIVVENSYYVKRPTRKEKTIFEKPKPLPPYHIELGEEHHIRYEIDLLGLSCLTRNALVRDGHFLTIKALNEASDRELLYVKRIGPKCLAEIREKIEGFRSKILILNNHKSSC